MAIYRLLVRRLRWRDDAPAMAQQVMGEPGYCAFYYPNANCQNKGPAIPIPVTPGCASTRRPMAAAPTDRVVRSAAPIPDIHAVTAALAFAQPVPSSNGPRGCRRPSATG